MIDGKQPTVLLEPLHLDTTMVLNAASLLLGGVSFTSEHSTASTKQGSGQAGISIPLLSSLFNMGGSASASSTVELREARQVTLGSIHMQVIEELRAKSMLRTLTPADLVKQGNSDQTYIEMRVVLMPLDYQAILRMLRTLAPLAAQVIQGFPQVRGRLPQLRPAAKHVQRSGQGRGGNQRSSSPETQEPVEQTWDTIAVAVEDTAKRLEEDILTSKQLDLIMVDPTDITKRLGIATLNLGDYSVAELQPKLARAEALVFGKVMRFVPDGEEMPLLEKTSLAQALDLVSRIPVASSPDDEGKPSPAAQLKAGRTYVEKVMPLFIQGPAVRILAMSVCV